jgi:hypothetical protein
MTDLKQANERLLAMRQMQAHAIAMSFWQRGIIDGTDKGNKVIGLEICDPPRDDYANGVVQWCGEAVGKWHELSGMHREVMGQMQSWYRATCLGTYMIDEGVGMPAYVMIDGKWILVEDWHKLHGVKRLWVDCRHGCPDWFVPRSGDIAIRMRDKAVKVGGHVMQVAGPVTDKKEVTGVSTVEGNTTGLLPNGQWKEGVVVKSRQLIENQVDYILRPSAYDYRLDVQYSVGG